MARLRQDNKLIGLVKAISEKAKELQNITESRDNAAKEIREFGERKQRLVKGMDTIDLAIKEKQEHLDGIVDRERKFLSESEKELVQQTLHLERIKKELVQKEAELLEAGARVKEQREFLEKASSAREEYLEWEKKSQEMQQSFLEREHADAATKKEIEIEKRELGEYKEYLSEFYGKVATYAVTAQETLASVNLALEKNIPLRFTPPSQPITMENFNKL